MNRLRALGIALPLLLFTSASAQFPTTSTSSTTLLLTPCVTDLECDDGLFCNGSEVCILGISCQPGAPPLLDDGIACTVDGCDEPTDTVTHTPTDVSCSDGAFCNGTERCDTALGCRPGLPVNCNDGIACSADTCNESLDRCVNAPVNSVCTDSNLCNGAESCSPSVGCVAGTPLVCNDGNPCTTDSCSPAAGCQNPALPNGSACTDGNLCNGNEICQAGACSPGTPLACNDGLFCNGTEVCNTLTGCTAGTAVNCSDGVACTIDTCNETTDACDHVTSNTACSDGLFCNGTETCNALAGCTAGTPVNCNDGIACTTDSCNEANDICTHAPSPAACSDGLFCNGAEVCNALTGCAAGAPLNCSDGIACTADACNEVNDVCNHAPSAAACNDGLFCNGTETCNALTGCIAGAPVNCSDAIACTVDTCNESTDSCNHAVNNSLCNDGLFCNGAETCNAATGCIAGASVNCNDAIACTTDLCNETTDTCDHPANNAACSDGLFCNGTEICNTLTGCTTGTPVNCGDGVACTSDSCDEAAASCAHAPNNGTCNDGDACNGVETCDLTLGCRSGGLPECDDGNPCTLDTCDGASGCAHSPVANGTSCDDGNLCNGTHTCQAGVCTAVAAPSCNDGLFCNGTESCNPASGCVPGIAPDCADAVACTVDACNETTDACTHTPNDLACNGAAGCNGAEICSPTAGCLVSPGAGCDDGVACTIDTCDSGTGACIHIPTHAACSDGRFCNGAETCQPASGCAAGSAPCNDGVGCTLDTCSEASDTCGHAADDLGCNDGIFCNGTEVCNPTLGCQRGAPPTCNDAVACTSDRCDLLIDDCTHAPDHGSCSDGNACNGPETCDGTLGCQPGVVPNCDDGNPCTVDACDAQGGCTHTVRANGSVCDDGSLCTDGDTCQAGACLPGPGLNCDDGNVCTADSCLPLLGCQHGALVNGTPCGDANACNGAETCQAGACQSAPAPTCNDGLFCNGVESCSPATGCVGGSAPCVDAVACTLDSCNEATDSCTHAPSDLVCLDDLFCNGMETCDPVLDCQPGSPPSCDDGIACTADACSDAAGACTYLPQAAACDDADACNGIETCNPATGCVSGTPLVCDDGRFCNGLESCNPSIGCQRGAQPCTDAIACTADSCSEATDTCIHAAEDLACIDGLFCNGLEFCDPLNDCTARPPPDCDDGISCTADSCNEAADRCDHAPDDLPCRDADACNGLETCDPALGCTSAAPLDCDDGNACTIDACDTADGCVNRPVENGTPCDDANVCSLDDTCQAGLCAAGPPRDCDDGSFCNGVEVCDAAAGCQSGLLPDCEDGVACTTDSCNEAADGCDHLAVAAVCDNGLFCDGSEVCNPVSGCQAGPSLNCNDGVACTVDSCDEAGDSCTHAPQASLCADGNACNGEERCDSVAGCLPGPGLECGDGNPCTADGCDPVSGCRNTAVTNGTACADGTVCNGAENCQAGLCVAGTPLVCSDGNVCTADQCDPASGCSHPAVANGTPCPDADRCDGAETCQAGTCAAAAPLACNDGRFCNGIETCDPATGCVRGVEPCDDSVDCTVDLCIEATDSCSFQADDLACLDGSFCNGLERCDPQDDCVNPGPPSCDDGIACTTDSCNPLDDDCVHAPADATCDDGNRCNGAETCVVGAGCQPGAAPMCDDSLFCNGAETCNPAAGCQPAPPPCDDAIACTVDACNEATDLCGHSPDDGACRDGAFCNGAERCDAFTGCQAPPPVDCDDGIACTTDTCNESGDFCDHVPNPAPCQDGNLCNGAETCNPATGCQAGAALVCSDSFFCNGAETCDVTLGCRSGTPPCSDGVACTVDQCNEVLDSCNRIVDHGACDDGLFCNGAESCSPTSGCEDGIAPSCEDSIACTVDLCESSTDACRNSPSDVRCDNGVFCDGTETCHGTAGCQAGTSPSMDDSIACTADGCDEGSDTIVHIPDDAVCGDADACNGIERCDLAAGCLAGPAPDCDDENPCTDDACDAVSGCSQTANIDLCDDGDPCSIDEICTDGVCTGTALECEVATASPPAGGATVSTDSEDDGATPEDPVETSVTSPNPGEILIVERQLPSGEIEVEISAPPATPADPLVIVYRLDASLGVDPSVQFRRDGFPVPDCNGAVGMADPDPCVDARLLLADGDVELTILGSTSSLWSFGMVADCSTPETGNLPDGTHCDDADACSIIDLCIAGVCVGATADCNDDNTCTIDRCETASGCLHESIPCDDGIACTLDSCSPADGCVATPADGSCDDGLFCNGAETCNPAIGCVAGTAPDCDDSVGCTADACSNAAGACLHESLHEICDNGQFCDGLEVCDLRMDCTAGSAPDPDDGVDCTDDFCDELADVLVHSPFDAVCNDGQFCNGPEICNALTGCQSGSPPVIDDGVGCTSDSCNETTDTVAHSPSNAACDDGLFCNGSEVCNTLAGCQAGTAPAIDDGIPCTADACREASDSVLHTPVHAVCSDGLFCNGAEACDANLGCQAGLALVIDDGVVCTADACDESADAVLHIASDAACDDGLLCNGQESCAAAMGCQSGVAPVVDDGVACTVDACDEALATVVHMVDHDRCDDGLFCTGAEVCEPATGCTPGATVVCNDGVACTVDACDEASDSCRSLPDDAACDDGQFCNGAETCDANLGCLIGPLPNCDDGIGCTDDSCDGGANACLNVRNDARCSNGLFCDGLETCDASLGCQAGPTPLIDDAIACTADACDEAADVVSHTPSDAACSDGALCNGAERCDPSLGCQAGSLPALDDGIACTADACDEAADVVLHTPSNAACDDNRFCNGAETCDATLGCRPGVPPILSDGIACTADGCREALDTVLHTPVHAACDDGLFCNGGELCNASLGCQPGTPPQVDDAVACTADACSETADRVAHTPIDTVCVDGLFCNGVETCDATAGCQPGPTFACDDGVDCTTDACDESTDACANSPDAAFCDDGLFCDGAETCDADLGCQAGEPVAVGDGVYCTADECDEPSDSIRHLPDDASCHNGIFCDGGEICDPTLGCQSGAAPDCNDGIACTADTCDEVVAGCAHTADDSACADDQFCNGAEVCSPIAGCQVGPARACDDGLNCTADSCDDAGRACAHLPVDADCDNGLACDGAELCDPLLGCTTGIAASCDDGVACTIDACDEATGACASSPDPTACDDGVFCNGAEVCDPALGCLPGASVGCADGLACTTDSCNEATDSCQNIESCPPLEHCGLVSGDCEPSDLWVWVAAASDPTAVLAGAMMFSADFAVGDDADPTADALLDQLLFANSTNSSFTGGSGDQVTYTIDLPVSGPWYVWARLYYPGALGSNDANSFLVSVDGGLGLKLGNHKGAYQLWHWHGDGSIEDGAFAALPVGVLAAGQHTVVVEKREVAPIPPRLDLLVFSPTPTPPPTDAEAVAALIAAGLLPDLSAGCVTNVDCTDGDLCNGAETCTAGACAPGTSPACEDGNPCTSDTCDPAAGCTHAPSGICPLPPDLRLWIPAATHATAAFSGAMVATTAFVGGADNDPLADSLLAELVFPNSGASAFAGGSGDLVTYSVTLPKATNWYLWGRFYYPGTPGSNHANSFLASVDGGTKLKLGNKLDCFQQWHWDGNGAFETGVPVALDLGFLAAGPHQITIEKREVAPIPPRLDVLLLSPSPLPAPTDQDAALGLGLSGALLFAPTTTTTLP